MTWYDIFDHRHVGHIYVTFAFTGCRAVGSLVGYIQTEQEVVSAVHISITSHWGP